MKRAGRAGVFAFCKRPPHPPRKTGTFARFRGQSSPFLRTKSRAQQNATSAVPGVFYIRVWLNEGTLKVGDSIMYVLIGADIRPHAVDALQQLVGIIKNDLVVEHENYE